MIENNSFLNRLNPVTKLILMVIPTILVSFLYDIYTPLVFFIFIFVISIILGNISFMIITKKMIKFMIIGLSFGMFVIVSNVFTNSYLTYEVLTTAISLCLRIMVFSLLSVIFVITTDPNEFGLSLIHQMNIPYKIVYPFLTAYSFVPTFQDELQKIILAKEIRGINSNNNLFSNIINIPKYILPLLTSAIRKGERVSLSMETRAFGIYEDRTYYHMTYMRKNDYISILLLVIISVIIMWIGMKYGFISFKTGLVL